MANFGSFDERKYERFSCQTSENTSEKRSIFAKMRHFLTMANTRFYLDDRKTKSGKPCFLKVGIAHKGMSAYITLEAKLFHDQWDSKNNIVVNRPDAKMLNVYIVGVKQQIDTHIITLANAGKLRSMTTAEVKNYILEQLHPEKAEAKRDAQRRKNLFAMRYVRYQEVLKDCRIVHL